MLQVLRLVIVVFVTALWSSAPFASALKFTSPPELAALGHVFSPLQYQTWQYIDTTVFGKNYTVQVAADYQGCFPDQQVWTGKLAWWFKGPSCTFGGNWPDNQQAAAFAKAGAVGVIASLVDSTAEQWASDLSSGVPSRIPVVNIRYVQNWDTPPGPNNPPVSMMLFNYGPTDNISAIFETPDVNELVEALLYPSSDIGFVMYTSQAMTFVALFLCIVKLTTFVVHEKGPKLSLAQIVLALCTLASWWLLFNLLYGPEFNMHYMPSAPAYFFKIHYVPYWYSAICIYAFYLLEVSLLTRQNTPGFLDKFKWPAFVVCSILFIIEIIEASIFAYFPGTIDFNQLVLMLSCVYIICAGLISIFLVVCTAFLLRNMLGSTIGVVFIIRVLVISGVLFLLLWLSTVFFFFNIAGMPNWRPEVVAFDACLWFSSFLAPITLALSFRVSVQKEIEMSKSATSSTSSGLASNSSSSSSSYKQDPVVEL